MQNLFGYLDPDKFSSKTKQLFTPVQLKPQESDNSRLFLKVPRGQFTFDLEGIESPGRRFHSRSASIPSSGSGVTIGRGFDLGQFSSLQIGQMLAKSGFDAPFIERAQGASLLEGKAAREYISTNTIRDISMQEQWSLFNETRNFMERDVRRISEKPDTVAFYGSVNWDGLSRITQDLFVDLRYRGDYSGETRKLLQPVLVNNDLVGLAQVLSDESYWISQRGVPKERFEARKELATSQLY